MTTKALISTILVSSIIIACNRNWVRIENGERFKWKKQNIEYAESDNVTHWAQCMYEKTIALNVLEANGFKIYEYDSIRVYAQQGDTLLNKLIFKGYIQGQFFFSDFESNKCNSIKWKNPVKVKENDWTGYHIYLSNFREIKTEKIPRQVRETWPLTKAWRLSFRYTGQPYINPSVFEIEIENSDYKMGHQDIEIEKFLEGGKTTCFYQIGFEA